MCTSSSETLAEIRGFFKAFEWVNSKVNHDCSFEIVVVEPAGDLASDVAAFFKVRAQESTTIQSCVDWRRTLVETFNRWLLAYLLDPPAIGRFASRSKVFSKVSQSCQEEMIGTLIKKIGSIATVQSAHNILVESDTFYACSYTDLVLVTSGPLIFLHFDVCD